MKKHTIRVVVQVGEEFGSARIEGLEGPDDAFDGMDLGDLAHVAAEGVVAFLTGEDGSAEDDDDEILALSLLDSEDDDDDGEGYGPN